MSAVALAVRLLHAGGRRSWATLALAVTGFAVTTALLSLTVGAWSGFDARAERTQWRTPQAVTDASDALAVQRTTTTAYDGHVIVEVDLAATGHGTAPTPPGLATFPQPGQVFVSPALAALVAEHPSPALADRFGPVTGQIGSIGPAGLAHPSELVAVIGHAPGDATMSAPAWKDQTRPGAYAGPTPVAGFTGLALANGQYRQYDALAQLAAALLLVPLVVLAGAAARLGLARRDQRLAALRLAGATPAQAVVATAVEAGATALVGAVLGVVGALALAPLAALVPVAGGAWYPFDLAGPPLALAGVVAGVLVLAVGSAVLATRQVLLAPLGVAARHTPRRLSPVRLVLFGVLLVAFLRYSCSGDPSLTVLIVVLAGVFGALAVVGPWVVGLLGQVVIARSRTAAGLLAGRRLVDDPRGAWRVVGAVAMTGFTAGLLALFPTGSGDPVWGSADRLDVAVLAAAASQTADALGERLPAAGVQADVTGPTSGPGADRGALLGLDTRGQDVAFISVHVHELRAGQGQDTQDVQDVQDVADGMDLARTVVAQVAPAAVAATGTDAAISEGQYLKDFTTGSVLVLGVSFGVAMASAAITAMAGALDRRRTYRQLVLIGVPLRVLDRARSLETLLPLVVLAVGASLSGIVVASPLTRLGLAGAGGSPLPDLSGLLLLTGALVVGVLGVQAASATSRPLLARVAADPTSAAD